MTIYLVLVGYIMFMFVLLLKMVIIPILVISRQIEQVGLGERDKVTKASRKDEIGQLAEAFNKMNERRKQVEAELREEIRQHQETLEDKKVLSGLIPICASCKNIRDDKGYWNQIEIYIREHSEAEFSHGLCPDCVKKLYPQHAAKILKEEHPNTEDNGIIPVTDRPKGNT
jgi:HAMP domain-containing protein